MISSYILLLTPFKIVILKLTFKSHKYLGLGTGARVVTVVAAAAAAIGRQETTSIQHMPNNGKPVADIIGIVVALIFC